MAKVIYYEIQVDDFKRAQKFYHAIFGWEFSKMDAPFEYFSIKSGDAKEAGIDGGMLKRQAPLREKNAIASFVSTISVDSVDTLLEKVIKHGGEIAMQKTTLEGVGTFAYALDTEGNTFGVWEK